PAATTAAAPTAAATQPTAAPAAATKPATAPAGQITIALGADVTTLDPQTRDDGNEHIVNWGNVFEGLVGRDQDEKMVPALAESWEQKDPTTWRFTLRKGVKFHNGEAFNAEAVASSVKRIIDPKLNSEQSSFYGTIKDAKAVD